MHEDTNSREHCFLCCNAVHFEDSSVFRRYIASIFRIAEYAKKEISGNRLRLPPASAGFLLL
jgi:hypothetical protein